MKFPTQYTAYERHIVSNNEPSCTDPTFEDECNLSLIVEKYKKTRIPPRTVNISYGHSPTIEDYENASYLMAETKSNFENLPSSVRDEFNNDVRNYLEYIGDSNNLKDCYERGLINPDSIPLDLITSFSNEIDTNIESDPPLDTNVNANS